MGRKSDSIFNLKSRVSTLERNKIEMQDVLDALKNRIYKLENPPKFKLGDTVNIFQVTYEPRGNIGYSPFLQTSHWYSRANYDAVKLSKEISGNPFKVIEIEFNNNTQRWEYACMNKDFTKVSAIDVQLEKTDDKACCCEE